MSRKKPSPRDLRRHEVPRWFADAKLGIFVHWGLSAVPAWAPDEGQVPELVRSRYEEAAVLAPYAEWYWNALRIPGSPTARHHARRWGDAPYEAFREPFESSLEHWDPAPWAALFAEAGARYVVQTTKHHDGYCMWPTRVANPRKPGWTARRDTVGDLARAVRDRGLRFGVYYSGGLDWAWTDEPIRTLTDSFGAMPLDPGYATYVERQYRELIERIRPSVLWNDIGYPSDEGLWQLIADYYAAVPDGVVNDRFLPVSRLLRRVIGTAPARLAVNAIAGRLVKLRRFTFVPPRPPHYDFRTPEYDRFSEARGEKWEATRGLGSSFGYNANDPEERFLGVDELVRGFVDIVANNGNLLLNVGPTAKGVIPEAQSRRLRGLGAWLRTNGEAIYGTRPWRRAVASREGCPLRFTRCGEARYVFVMEQPRGDTLTLPDLAARSVELLGQGVLNAREGADGLVVAWPPDAPAQPVHALELAR